MRKEDGSIAVETVIIVPILVWAYLAMFTIFDAYRQYTMQQKAAYTVSDLISRQATPLDASFLDGAHSLLDELTRAVGEIGFRVTVVNYDLVNQQYAVVWSRTRGGMIGLQSADVANWTNNLPVLPQDDQIVIVETSAMFQPVFRIGLGDQTINNFVFTRPRYAKQLCFGSICDNNLPDPFEALPDEQG
ncbi:MAG: TadE/TadG family type IV pilus assembly protein [Roseobacter sp.]